MFKFLKKRKIRSIVAPIGDIVFQEVEATIWAITAATNDRLPSLWESNKPKKMTMRYSSSSSSSSSGGLNDFHVNILEYTNAGT
eukprot:scaffold2261_cov124-Cylindrotheca_fusiformis.AAC.13